MTMLNSVVGRIGWISFCLFNLILVISAPVAHAAVGRTPGNFAISPSGSATYTLPIWTPPGPAGLQPHIALTYSSQAGNGIAGVGWNLSGLSSIYRCNLTTEQDGIPAAVSLTPNDGLCLDGKRLRLVSGVYGQAGSSYQTEIADFSTVTAVSTLGNGPDHFIVKDRNGTSYQYGATSSSQVVVNGTALNWLLCKVTDATGNTEVITYTQTTGTASLDTISWTPTSYGANTYQYTMKFNYKANVAVPFYAGYVSGVVVQNPNILNNITITGPTVGTTGVLKKYVLSYQAGPATGRSQLISVKECADDAASDCLQPTQFAYQKGAMGVGSAITLTTSSTAPTVSYSTYDLNGDGINDMAWYDGSNWKVAFGGPNGFSTPLNTGITAAAAVIENIDGSGTDSFLAPVSGTWVYYKWNGSSFATASTGVSVVDQTTAFTFALADVNGDGLPDLITTRSDNYLYVRLNTSSAGAVSFSTVANKTIPAGSIFSSAGPTRHLDFNGSGQQDLISISGTSLATTSSILHFNGTTFLSYASTSLIAIAMADFNDDGCTDILYGNALVISPCNGTASKSIPTPGRVLAAVDWDGDGRRDLLVQNGNAVQVYLSNGISFNTTPIPTSLPPSLGSTSVNVTYGSIHNSTGDGLDGIVTLSASAPYTIQYYLHNGASQPADLLMQVTDGYGNSVSLTYASLARSLNTVYFPSTPATYPYQYYIGPLYVLSQVSFSDPSASNGYQINYYYGSAWTHLRGRGFAGFHAVQQHDSRGNGGNGIWYTSTYGQAFPFTGQFQGLAVRQTNSSAFNLSSSYVALNSIMLSNVAHQQRYFTFASSTGRYDYELGSSQNRAVKHTNTDYTYDNYGNVLTAKTVVTDLDSGSPYNGTTWTTFVQNTPAVDTSTWCLSLYSQTQVSYASTDGGPSAPTRTKALTPDTSHCHYTQIVTEPSSTVYKVTEVLSYDHFGNVNYDNITGANMAARAVLTDWGTTGQFPIAITNALNQKTTLSYDFGRGVLTSQTDANGLKTNWSYDTFGRKSVETRPDGTSTQYVLHDCASENNCTRDIRTRWSAAVLDKNKVAINTTSTNLDSLDRTYQVWTKTLNAASSTFSSFVTTNYDLLGRVVGQSLPTLTGSPQYFTTTLYDALSRPYQVSRPFSASNSTQAITHYVYSGDTTTVTDANGNTKTLVTDPKGQLRTVTDATGYRIGFAYDAAGSPSGTTDSLGTILSTAKYQYGVQPFATTRMDADLGTWTYAYDALGEVTDWKDAKGQTFRVAYDPLGRTTDRYEPDFYTHWTWGTNAALHEIQQLAKVCTGVGTNPGSCTSTGYAESETYDNMGRPSARSIQIPGDTTYTYNWNYDSTSGLLDTFTYPADTSGYRLQLKYGYVSGLLKSITDVPDNITLWTANADNERLQFTQEVLGNGVVVNHTFEPVTGLPSSITAGVGGGAAVQNNSYLFDAVGNLTQRQDNNVGYNENIYVDALNRFDHNVGDPNSMQMAYDAMGRLSQWGSVGGTPNTRDYATAQPGCSYYSNSQPHAVRKSTQGVHSSVSCYDQNGNMVSLTNDATAVRQSTWTSFNQPMMLSVTGATLSTTGSTVPSSTQFFYDHNHQRWKQVESYSGTPDYSGAAETTEYIGGQLERMQNVNGVVYRYYVTAGNNTIVVSRPGNGTTVPYYLTADHLGSVAAATNQAGTVLVHGKFAALGWKENSVAEQATLTGITRHGFTGQESLDAPGLFLVNMNGRIYHPSGNTFLSPDPTAVHDLTNTISYNRYAYANYNPLRFTDPSGFSPTDGCFTSNQGLDYFPTTTDWDKEGSGSDGDSPPPIGECLGGGPNPPSPPPEIGCSDSDPSCTVTVPGNRPSPPEVPCIGPACTVTVPGTPYTPLSPPPLPPPTILPLPSIVPLLQVPQIQYEPNPTLCNSLSALSGAAGGAVAGVLLSGRTGGDIRKGAVVGAVVGGFGGYFAKDGGIGAFLPAGLGSVLSRFTAGFSYSGFTQVLGDAFGASVPPGAGTIPAGVVVGAVAGAVQPVLGLGRTGSALVSGGAGGIAAGAGYATTLLLNVALSKESGCSL